MPGILAFVAGALLFQQLPELPSPHWLWLLPLLLPIGWRCRRLRLPLLVAAGVGWSLLHAQLSAPAFLPPGWIGKNLEAEGAISGLPRRSGEITRFFFDADRLRLGEDERRGSWRFRLNWYGSAPQLSSGDRWRLVLRLKPVVGYRNPGSFDYAGWLYAQGVRYSGYVREEGSLLRPGKPGLDRLRQEISESLGASLEWSRPAAVMRALTVGDRGGLSAGDREVFAATGTSHLMAISGLHVGLVFGLVFLLVEFVWRRFPMLCGRWPARVAACFPALLASFGYAALAGFSLATQRALIMVAVMAAALVLRRHLGPFRGLGLALLLVVLWDPMALQSAGFWLSFGAVAIILLVLGRGRSRWNWLWIQAGISVGLMPVLLWQQMPVSLISPLVNLLAIPLFSLVVVPGTLLATGWEVFSGWHQGPLLQAMAWLIDRFLDLLDRASGWNPSLEGAATLLWMLLPLLVAGWLWLARVGSRTQRVAILGVLGVLAIVRLATRPPSPPANAFDLELLDVGQGLSAVVRTAGHLLVFDTGPAFPSGFNTGTAVVAPYLDGLGVGRIDRLILSHGDQDHVGGARGLLRRLPADEILGGEPKRLSLDRPVLPCREGQQWWWDGVHFQVLWPPAGERPTGNEASCVLRVSTAGHSLLLTGDIGVATERMLVERYGDRLASDLVVAAHHGSAGSSSPSFVSAASPELVLFSAGFRNRWGFPRPTVVERWCGAGARPLDTAREGSIRVHFGAEGMELAALHARHQRRYWQVQMERQVVPACSMIAGSEYGG